MATATKISALRKTIAPTEEKGRSGSTLTGNRPAPQGKALAILDRPTVAPVADISSSLTPFSFSLFRSAWADHVLRSDERVEFGIGDIAAANRFLAQGGAVLMRRLGDLGRRIITNLRRQGGDQHQ